MTGTDPLQVILPPRPLAPGVRALSTTRRGGVSAGSYASLNLGTRTGDDPGCVEENRRRLRACARRLADAPLEALPWIRQVHGTRVVRAEEGDGAEADGAWTQGTGIACAVLTADCLPVILARADGGAVAALHAGWRGLAAGVLEAGVAELRAANPASRGTLDPGLTAWLGPCIGPEAFEVGPEVRTAFLEADPGAEACFREAPRTEAPDRLLADLQGLAQRRLEAVGVTPIERTAACTHDDPGRFYSHRRDGTTGRMATVVWRTPRG